MNLSRKHVCNFCSKEYIEKFNYDRHYTYCEFVNKSKREQINEIESIEPLPSSIQMYKWMQEMAVRIDKLEKENAKLKHAQTQKRKINVIEWLNNSQQLVKPDMALIDWIPAVLFPLIPTFLEIVYETDLMTGINALFKHAIENTLENKLPIRAFDIKTNTFYVYDRVIAQSETVEGAVVGDNRSEKNCWKIISTTDFDKYLDRISHQFIVDFSKCWYVANEDKIENDEKYKDLYIKYYQQILGGTKLTKENQFQKIRHVLYENIKRTIKNMVECDYA